MDTVTVSSRFQVVIPKKVREMLNITPGQELKVFVYGNHIQLVPVRPVREMRGRFRGIDTHIERDEEDRV